MANVVGTWKDKILDYEIETFDNTDSVNVDNWLEKIRFSITRLKLETQGRVGRAYTHPLKR